MKLLIKYYSFGDDQCWTCELPDDKAIWMGEGDSPVEAFNNYIELVKRLDQPMKGHIDYNWCRDWGLIK